ncbi:hypothetical protein [Rhizobium sp. 11515TR]|uniref:hypothetical protein n=1 Tax=unclassified Rhizobium TaxID=2613769 RepID=UPI0011B439A9|nr:hypothetical protein [Rhizobium sp. 11515TR]
MLAQDEFSIGPYAQLNHGERLHRVDLLAATISRLAFDVAEIGDSVTVRSLLDIGWMLKVMREDQAADCSSSNLIIDNAVRLVRTIKARCQEHFSVRTIH